MNIKPSLIFDLESCEPIDIPGFSSMVITTPIYEDEKAGDLRIVYCDDSNQYNGIVACINISNDTAYGLCVDPMYQSTGVERTIIDLAIQRYGVTEIKFDAVYQEAIEACHNRGFIVVDANTTLGIGAGGDITPIRYIMMESTRYSKEKMTHAVDSLNRLRNGIYTIDVHGVYANIIFIKYNNRYLRVMTANTKKLCGRKSMERISTRMVARWLLQRKCSCKPLVYRASEGGFTGWIL